LTDEPTSRTAPRSPETNNVLLIICLPTIASFSSYLWTE
jgi:hypothetical protein